MLLGYPVFAKRLSSVEDKLANYCMLEKLFSYKEMSGEKMVNNLKIKITSDWKINSNSIRSKQLVEIQTKLSRYLLVQQGDRQSMSHSVEQRFPFLDEDLTDFLFSIPDEYFEQFYMNKKLLRDSMSASLPESIVYRKKQGYLSPMDQQLYKSEPFLQLIKLSSTERFSNVVR